jgi:hypothetical protein
MRSKRPQYIRHENTRDNDDHAVIPRVLGFSLPFSNYARQELDIVEEIQEAGFRGLTVIGLDFHHRSLRVSLLQAACLLRIALRACITKFDIGLNMHTIPPWECSRIPTLKPLSVQKV